MKEKTSIKHRSCLSYLIIFTCVFVLPFLGSCNKTEDFEDLNLLIEKEWHLVSRTQNNLNITESCDLDDVLYFENATAFIHNFGAQNCFDYEANKTGNKWKLTEDFTVLRMKYSVNENNSKNTLVEYWKIIALSDSLLILEDAIAADNDQVPEIRTFKN